MTFKTMCDEFNDVVISIDESNRLTTSEMKTPLKSLVGKKGAAVVVSPIAPSPSDSAGSSVSSSSSVSSDDEPSSSNDDKIIPMSEHKLAEMNGLHAEEPLLRENPNRFVLFPIQDNDVSIPLVPFGFCRAD